MEILINYKKNRKFQKETAASYTEREKLCCLRTSKHIDSKLPSEHVYDVHWQAMNFIENVNV